MPILDLDAAAGTLTQECAKCSKLNPIALASLELGIHQQGSTPDDVVSDPDVIRLPPCSCGAQEFINRTWDETPPEFHGSHHDRHRRVVNGLGEHLKAIGRSHQKHKAAHSKEPRRPSDFEDVTKKKLKLPSVRSRPLEP